MRSKMLLMSYHPEPTLVLVLRGRSAIPRLSPQSNFQAVMGTCSGGHAMHRNVWGAEPVLLELLLRWTMTWVLTHRLTWEQAAWPAAAAAVELVGPVS